MGNQYSGLREALEERQAELEQALGAAEIAIADHMSGIAAERRREQTIRAEMRAIGRTLAEARRLEKDFGGDNPDPPASGSTGDVGSPTDEPRAGRRQGAGTPPRSTDSVSSS